MSAMCVRVALVALAMSAAGFSVALDASADRPRTGRPNNPPPPSARPSGTPLPPSSAPPTCTPPAIWDAAKKQCIAKLPCPEFTHPTPGPVQRCVPDGWDGDEDAMIVQARARFLEGLDATYRGAAEPARIGFYQAYALKRHPGVLLQLAESTLRAGRALDSTRYFHRFLRETPALTTPQRSEAERGLAEASLQLGALDVHAPAGSEVSVDGERVGGAPLADSVFVAPGSHQVSVKGADGASTTQTVAPTAGQRLAVRFAAPSPASPPVAAPPSPPVARFTASSDGVRDNRTNLVWRRQVRRGSFADAARYCSEGNWRLPTLAELMAVSSLSGQDAELIPSGRTEFFWTTSQDQAGSSRVTIVRTVDGYSKSEFADFDQSVRCVK